MEGPKKIPIWNLPGNFQAKKGFLGKGFLTPPGKFGGIFGRGIPGF